MSQSQSDKTNIKTLKQVRQQTKAPRLLGAAFNSLSYLKNNYMEPTSIGTAVLLGTTALTPTLLGIPYNLGTVGLLATSFYLLMKTSDIVVDNAQALGKKFGVAALTLGVALGAVTSLPELFVSLESIFQGSPDIGIGNIIGSNIANILGILGITAIIAKVHSSKGISWKFNTLSMLGATAAFGGLMATGSLPVVAGVGMLGLLGGYIAGSYIYNKRDVVKGNDTFPDDTSQNHLSKLPKTFNALWGLAGIGGLVYSADLLVNSASTLALSTGISPAIVGAIAVSIGTSLPELIVSINAARKGETQMAVGNVIGSNVFNLLMVGGALALANTQIPEAFNFITDLGKLNTIFFGGSAALLAACLYKNNGGLKKSHGYIGLGLYAAYTASSFLMNPGNITAQPSDNIKMEQTVSNKTASYKLSSIIKSDFPSTSPTALSNMIVSKPSHPSLYKLYQNQPF